MTPRMRPTTSHKERFGFISSCSMGGDRSLAFCCRVTSWAWLCPTQYPFSADAVEPVTACRFARGAFSALLDEKPHLLRRLHEAATHELSLAQDHMVLLGRRTADEKVAAFLLGLRDRWRRLGGSLVTIPLPMTRQDIADYLGLTLETVSRTISKFARSRMLLVVPDGVRF